MLRGSTIIIALLCVATVVGGSGATQQLVNVTDNVTGAEHVNSTGTMNGTNFTTNQTIQNATYQNEQNVTVNKTGAEHVNSTGTINGTNFTTNHTHQNAVHQNVSNQNEHNVTTNKNDTEHVNSTKTKNETNSTTNHFHQNATYQHEEENSCAYTQPLADQQLEFYFDIIINVSSICDDISRANFTSDFSSALCEYHNEVLKYSCPDSDAEYLDCILTEIDDPCETNETHDGGRKLRHTRTTYFGTYSRTRYYAYGLCGRGCPTTPFPYTNAIRQLRTGQPLLVKILRRRGFKKVKDVKVLQAKKTTKCASPFATSESCEKTPYGMQVSVANNPGYLRAKPSTNNTVKNNRKNSMKGRKPGLT
uniref:Uncharacterized protein n=2 Tax=Ditylum brightwellii TaxID=49249 RepID=A0A6V2CME2_9STRA